MRIREVNRSFFINRFENARAIDIIHIIPSMTKKKSQQDSLSVIIPAYNEGRAVGFVVKDVLKLSKHYQLEIIVVSDGSTDNTAATAKKAGAHKVIEYKKNRGKGGAFQTGIKHATGTYVVQIDADRQLLASEIPQLLEPLQNGFDMTLGARYDVFSLLKSDAVSLLNLSGNLMLSLVASLFARRNITDVMTGFKAFKRKALLDINPKVDHFGYETEVVIKAAKKGYKIKTILITCERRMDGKSNLKIVKDGVLVLKTIVNSAVRD